MLARSRSLERINKLFDYDWHLTAPCEGEKLHKDAGGRPALLRFLRAVIRAAHTDPVVARAFAFTIFGLGTALSLLAPHVLARIAYDAWWRRRGEAADPGDAPSASSKAKTA
jgi:hypothetical protein